MSEKLIFNPSSLYDGTPPPEPFGLGTWKAALKDTKEALMPILVIGILIPKDDRSKRQLEAYSLGTLGFDVTYKDMTEFLDVEFAANWVKGYSGKIIQPTIVLNTHGAEEDGSIPNTSVKLVLEFVQILNKQIMRGCKVIFAQCFGKKLADILQRADKSITVVGLSAGETHSDPSSGIWKHVELEMKKHFFYVT